MNKISFKHLNYGIVILDKSKNIINYNDYFKDTICCDDILGKNIDEFIHKEDLKYKINIDHLIKNKKCEKEIRFFNFKNKKYFWTNTIVSLFEDNYLVEVQNINENKIYEEKLKRSIKDLEDFAYIISHDLKAPLRQMGQIVEWIIEDKDEMNEKNLNLLSQKSIQLQTMINSILEYSKATRLSDVKNEEKFNVKELVNELIVELTDSFKNYKINFVIPKEMPTILFNKMKFYQILQNLFCNSISHNDKKEVEIKLDFEIKNNKILFSVKDNGPGIKPEYHEKIMEMFGSRIKNGKVEGRGSVGLAIVKKLILDNNGEYQIESKEGEGFKFIFIFDDNILI